MTRRKIAIASFRYEQGGGAAGVARELSAALRDRGHHVVFITTQRKRGVLRERVDGIDIIRMRPANLYWIGDRGDQPAWKRAVWQLLDLWNPHAYSLLSRVLRSERPELLHVHKLRGFSPAIWSAARKAGTKAILQTAHDYELISPEGTLTGRIGRSVERKSLWSRAYQAPRRAASSAVGVATAPSQHTLDRIVSHGFFPHAKQRVIPNSHGFSRDQLTRIRLDCESTPTPGDSAPLRLLYLGRLEAVKGVDLLCETVSELARELPGLRLDVAGWGASEARLRERFDTHPAIQLHGTVSGDAKHKLLANSDALVVPSLWPEVFGLVIAEAFAFGLPVVAFAAGAIPELVREGENGYLVPPADTQALASRLRALAENPQSVRRLAPACFEAASRLSREQFVADYLDLYSEVSGTW